MAVSLAVNFVYILSTNISWLVGKDQLSPWTYMIARWRFVTNVGSLHREAADRGAEVRGVLRGRNELRWVRGLQDGRDVAGEGGEGGDRELSHQHEEGRQWGPVEEGRAGEPGGSHAASQRRPAEDIHGARRVQAAQWGPGFPVEPYHQCESEYIRLSHAYRHLDIQFQNLVGHVFYDLKPHRNTRIECCWHFFIMDHRQKQSTVIGYHFVGYLAPSKLHGRNFQDASSIVPCNYWNFGPCTAFVFS